MEKEELRTKFLFQKLEEFLSSSQMEKEELRMIPFPEAVAVSFL